MRAKIKHTAGWCPRMGDTGVVEKISGDPAEEYSVTVRFVGICGRSRGESFDLVLNYRAREVELIDDGAADRANAQ